MKPACISEALSPLGKAALSGAALLHPVKIFAVRQKTDLE